MARMLNWSDNDAAMTLWKKYEGAAGLARWRNRFGMKDACFVPGFAQNWGFMKASARDFEVLVSYVLDDTASPIRQYLVSAAAGC
ncbi:MAG: tat pathway signal sequence, partial [Mycobacteriales bacterium]